MESPLHTLRLIMEFHRVNMIYWCTESCLTPWSLDSAGGDRDGGLNGAWVSRERPWWEEVGCTKESVRQSERWLAWIRPADNWTKKKKAQRPRDEGCIWSYMMSTAGDGAFWSILITEPIHIPDPEGWEWILGKLTNICASFIVVIASLFPGLTQGICAVCIYLSSVWISMLQTPERSLLYHQHLKCWRDLNSHRSIRTITLNLRHPSTSEGLFAFASFTEQLIM